MESNKKRIAAYLMDKVSGGMIGVNEFGLLIADFFQRGKTLQEITVFCVNNLDQKGDYAELESKVSHFLRQLEACKLTPNRLRILKRNDQFQILNAQLDLSWKCNLSCRHCYLGDTTLIEEALTLSEWQNIIDQLHTLNVPKITFLGGEPLLARHLFDLASYAFSKGFKLFTTTNGTLVSTSLAGKLRKSGFNEIDVSIDGSSAESHEFLRGNQTFNPALRGIRYLIDAGIAVKTATVLNKKNHAEIYDILKLGKQLGIEHMYFNPLLPGGQGNSFWREFELNFNDWIEIKSVIKEWNQKELMPKGFAESSFDFLISLNKEDIANMTSDYIGCKGGKRELIITPDGFIAACPLLTTKRMFHTMNVRKYSIAEIWKNDQWIINLRNVNEHTKKGKCQDCDALVVCQGGCHILSLLELGDIYQSDPRCPHIACSLSADSAA